MPKFALAYPYFIIMLCLVVAVVGITTVVRMPVDLFPQIDIPVVVVATFYSGMPPQQIEADITNTFERFFTLGSNIDHIESRSLTGVSLIKIYFKPGTDANAALSNIANLAMADLRRLPPGTLPPVVLKFDASSLPVCLVTLKGQGLNETRLKDLAQFQVRNQIANVQGASVPQPFGGTYRQIQVFVDPVKLEAHQLSLMDVVHAINDSNLILPAGDVRIGNMDYNIYANSQVAAADEINSFPLKTVGLGSVLVADIGKAQDSGAIQTNIVRIDGQHSVYIPILKQGGNSNTISIVNGIKEATRRLVDIPDVLKTAVVFDQSIFVKIAIKNLLKEGGIGLLLTAIMILLFLGSPRATFAVLLSIPLSALMCFLIMNGMGGSINTMLLGGLALAFSRLIDDSVVVLENIFRFMENGAAPHEAAEKGGMEVALAVLAATSTTSIVFFPGYFFLRSQPLPVHRSCSGSRFIYFCLLCFRHDRRTALLRKLYPTPPRRPTWRNRQNDAFFAHRQRLQRSLPEALAVLQQMGAEGSRWSETHNSPHRGRDRDRFGGTFSLRGHFVFPTHRSRAIRDRCQSSHGNAPGNHRHIHRRT
jgi:multidrug efflux pump subunit AcrB